LQGRGGLKGRLGGETRVHWRRVGGKTGGEPMGEGGIGAAVGSVVSCVWAVVMELIEKKYEGRRTLLDGEEKVLTGSEGVTFSLVGNQVSSNATFWER